MNNALDTTRNFPLEQTSDILPHAWADLLARWPWEWFATFTFRDPVHPEAADKRFRGWISEVSESRRRRVFFDGVAGIRWVRALELQRRGVIHFHALLSGLGKLSYRQARDTWREGFSWIEGVKSQDAVGRYVSKYLAKGGELELGGDGFSDRGLEGWPSRMFSRKKLERALAALTESEQRELTEWALHDRRWSRAPVELLARARVAAERRGRPVGFTVPNRMGADRRGSARRAGVPVARAAGAPR